MRTLIAGLACSLLLLVGTANADIIANIGTASGGTWQPFPNGGLNEQGLPLQPYWDDKSADGTQRNIGYFLTGTTGYPQSPNLTNPSYVGVGYYAPASIIFQSTGSEMLTVLLHATGNADEWGVFNAANPSQTTSLFTTATPVGTSISFTSPYASYGFYLHYLPSSNPAIPTDYYKSVASSSVGTEAAYNATNQLPSHQHFAVFAGPGGTSSQNYVIGSEDGWGTNNPITISGITTNERTGDYQDFVVSITNIPALSTPEPASAGLILAGLLGLAAFRARKVTGSASSR